MYANGNEVTTLAQANEVRAALELAELTLDDFVGETQESVDWAIANSYELADAEAADVVSEIKAVLAASREAAAAAAAAAAAVVEPPTGYERAEDSSQIAYIKSNYLVPAQAIKLLIGAANGQGQDHQSARVSGWSTDWTAYVHVYGDNSLFAYTYDGEHTDGWPMVTVSAGGKVNAGNHDFAAW